MKRNILQTLFVSIVLVFITAISWMLLATNTKADPSAPTSISAGDTVTIKGGAKVKFTQVSARSRSTHSLGLASDGTAYAWGSNNYGELGNGTISRDPNPLPVAVTTTGTPMAGKTITAVSAGSYYSLALAGDGTVYTWGRNNYGQLGNGTTDDSNIPVAVTTTGTPMAGKTITAISAGRFHSLALASDGTVYAWGFNEEGQLGNGTTDDSNIPVAVTTTGTSMAGKTITAISGGYSHSLALASNGTVYAWGYNDYGQLGNGTTTVSNKPVAVTTTGTPIADKTITAISAGYSHSLALASDGTVYAWGNNGNGRLGNGTTTHSNKPVAITDTPMAGKTITAISAGSSHSLALASDGTVYAWGYNGYGQLGNGATDDSNIPVAITTAGMPMAGKTITAISAGSSHSLALASDGTVYAWGFNEEGQLGNGTNVDSNLPVATIMPSNTPTAITVGGVPATNIQVLPNGDITFTAPEHTPGVVDVVITFDNGTSRTIASSYEYPATPSPDPTPTPAPINPSDDDNDSSSNQTNSNTPGAPNTGAAKLIAPMLPVIGVVMAVVGIALVVTRVRGHKA